MSRQALLLLAAAASMPSGLAQGDSTGATGGVASGTGATYSSPVRHYKHEPNFADSRNAGITATFTALGVIGVVAGLLMILAIFCFFRRKVRLQRSTRSVEQAQARLVILKLVAYSGCFTKLLSDLAVMVVVAVLVVVVVVAAAFHGGLHPRSVYIPTGSGRT